MACQKQIRVTIARLLDKGAAGAAPITRRRRQMMRPIMTSASFFHVSLMPGELA
jgi:hypothetical protein